MVVLVVAPHPDDEVLGCGGVIARHTAQGDNVYVIIVGKGIPELFPPEMFELARSELEAAHVILGVRNTIFLNFPAPQFELVGGHKLADAIRRVIHDLQPQLIYLPHRGDIHTDHRAVYNAVLVAARPLMNCPVRKLLCYETLSETEWAPPFGDDAFIPTVFVDISDYLDHKLRAMACYRSQLKEPPNSRSLRSIEALARLRGGTVSLDAAEAFMLVREVID